MDAVAFCLSLVDRHLKTNVSFLRQTVPEASSKMGMREDDVLATLMHQMWAGCYSNALSLPASVSIPALPAQAAEALLKPHHSPMRFPAQTLVDIDKLVKEFAEGRLPSDGDTTDWRDTWSGANSCCRSEAFSTAAAAQDFCATAAAEDLSGAGGAGDFALPASDFFSRKAMELYQTERGLSWSG
ncbi:hypothetical protein, conserved [Eimeria acervulina]|uniref:Uncharacterized protein n=1 Tax=Eimeria acervulina TaxID=5801 RepID=U6GDL1_EIMAC|nr:hypothetical protein, conserved [Eimeria acervulina]CDI77428.1 hypothetical protein, conserved [Eimeria acervulina]